MERKLRKVIIPAAGLGTRFLPATKAQPKEMLPIFDKPAIQIVVEEAVSAGVSDVIMISGRNKQAIENHFDRSLELEYFLKSHGRMGELRQVRRISELANIIYTRQKEPLGLGHAILCARPLVEDGPFGVILADDIITSKVPAIKQLWEVHKKHGGCVIAIMEVPKDHVSSYGIVAGEWIGSRIMRVRRMVEKPSPAKAPSNCGIVGRYILSARLLHYLERTRRGVRGEIQLTDALKCLAASEPVFAYRFEGIRYDAGEKIGYVEATLAHALRDPEIGPKVKALLKRGVRV